MMTETNMNDRQLENLEREVKEATKMAFDDIMERRLRSPQHESAAIKMITSGARFLGALERFRYSRRNG